MILMATTALFACNVDEAYDYDVKKCVEITEDDYALNPAWREFY